MPLRSTLETLFIPQVALPGEATTAELEEFVRFRNEIYIQEGYLSEASLSDQTDAYDNQSTHIAIRNSESGRLAGYCRMIHAKPLCTPLLELLPDLEKRIGGIPELSRFCIHNHWRGQMDLRSMGPMFMLGHELLRVSRQRHIPFMCCLIDRKFHVLCQRYFRMHFDSLDEPVDYLGSACVPCLLDPKKTIQNNLNNPAYAAFWGTEEIKAWVREFANHDYS